MATEVAIIEYLVCEILLRLPVKSVIRFKCVSKQWLALISEPKFCHSHTLRLYKNSHVIPSALLLAPYDSEICPIIPLRTSNVSDSSDFHNVEVPIGTVIQSCNGLLLIECCTMLDFGERLDYFICNPTTNESVPVIFSPSFRGAAHFIWFEPLKSPYYKLVSIGRHYDILEFSDSPRGNKYNFSVYSSESRSWSESRFAFTLTNDDKAYGDSVVFVNGTLYWYTSNLRNVCLFDCETLSFKKCPNPFQFENFSVLHFGFSGGHLLFVLRSPFSQIDILKLNVENFEYSVISNCKQLEASDVGEMSCLYSSVELDIIKGSIIVSISAEKIMTHNLTDFSEKVLLSFNSGQLPLKGSQIFPHYEHLSCVRPFDP